MHDGWVRDASAEALWVSLSFRVTGRVAPLDVSDDPSVLNRLSDAYRPRQPVRVCVLGVVTDKAGKLKVNLSLRKPAASVAAALSSSSPATAKTKGLKGSKAKAAAAAAAAANAPAAGSVVSCRIARVRAGRGVDVQLHR